MSKTKILYRGIDLRGKRVQFTIEHEHPEFKEESFTFNKHNFIHSIDQQIMEWLDDQDKMNIIWSRDLSCIVDYEVKKVKRKVDKKVLFGLLVDELVQREQLRIDIKLTYVGMYESIKKLSIDKQLKIVLASLGISYRAATNAYQNIIDIHDSFKPKEHSRLA